MVHALAPTVRRVAANHGTAGNFSMPTYETYGTIGESGEILASTEKEEKKRQNDGHSGEHPKHHAFAAHEKPHWPKVFRSVSTWAAIQLLVPRAMPSVTISAY